MFLKHVYAVLDFKSSHPKYSQNMSAYIDRAKKKVRRLKIENFDQASKKRTPANSGQF